MKMIGVWSFCATRWLFISRPVVPGIWISETMHDVAPRCTELRYSSAESKVHTSKPNELTSRSIAARTDSWSSTTEMSGILSSIVCIERYRCLLHVRRIEWSSRLYGFPEKHETILGFTRRCPWDDVSQLRAALGLSGGMPLLDRPIFGGRRTIARRKSGFAQMFPSW